MSAWVLALWCLLSNDVPASRTVPPSHELDIYLSVDASQPKTPLEHMRRELSALMRAAGFRVIWGDTLSPDQASTASELVVLELRGICGLPAGTLPMERAVDSGASLAEAAVSAGVVLPFGWVNCANLTRLIGPALASESMAQRDYLYGRAMARVAAHELYHIVMGSPDHGREGVAKPQFTISDLLDESFVFDAGSLARLCEKTAEPMAAPRSGGADTAVRR